MLLLSSCEATNDEPYYRFSNTDYDFIPINYQETTTISKYKNQENEEVQIASRFYVLSKQYNSGIGFGQPSRSEPFFYGDPVSYTHLTLPTTPYV